jgi:hypothetical protein
MAWVTLIFSLIKLGYTIYMDTKDKPEEERRKDMGDFSKAVDVALDRKKRDLRELSKWFGRRL